MNRIGLVAFALVCLGGCASVNSYDVPKVQQSLSDAMVRSDEVAQKAVADFADKKALVENVGKSGSPAFRDAEPGLRMQLSHMQAELTTMQNERKKMAAANSDVASLAYSRQKLYSSDEGADKFEAAVREFRVAADAANKALAEYSQSSNGLTEMISTRKLYLTFESADFFKRVQSSIRVAQNNSAEMQKEIDRSSKLLEHGVANKGALKNLEALSDSMQSTAQAYTEKAQSLAGITSEVRAITADTRVTSLDPVWPKVQDQLLTYEKTTQELESLNKKFLKQVEEFRSAARRK